MGGCAGSSHLRRSHLGGEQHRTGLFRCRHRPTRAACARESRRVWCLWCHTCRAVPPYRAAACVLRERRHHRDSALQYVSLMCASDTRGCSRAAASRQLSLLRFCSAAVLDDISRELWTTSALIVLASPDAHSADTESEQGPSAVCTTGNGPRHSEDEASELHLMPAGCTHRSSITRATTPVDLSESDAPDAVYPVVYSPVPTISTAGARDMISRAALGRGLARRGMGRQTSRV